MSEVEVHWRRLGLAPTTRDRREVQLAYRKLALQLHPDRNLQASADVRVRNEAQFKELVESYEYCINTLNSSSSSSSSPSERSFQPQPTASTVATSTSTPGSRPTPPTVFAAFDSFANFAEYFEDCVRKVEFELRWQQRVPLEVNLQELYRGVVIEVELANHGHRCTECDSALGARPRNAREGFARARKRFLSHLARPQGWESALHLAASGIAMIASASSSAAETTAASSSSQQRLEQGPPGDRSCARCNGTGATSNDICLRVSVPARSRPGQEVVFPDQASWTPDHSSLGDLVFVLDAPKHWIAPSGDEWLLRCDGGGTYEVTVAVTLRDALFGNDCLSVSHLDGTQFQVVVHAQTEDQPPKVEFSRGTDTHPARIASLKVKTILPANMEKLSAAERQSLDSLLSRLSGHGQP